MRRLCAATLAISSLVLLAGCAANPSLSNLTSSFAPFTLMVWLFAVSAIGLLTGCGSDNSGGAPPNTFRGTTSTTGTTGGTTGTSGATTTGGTTTTGSTGGTTTATQQNKLAFLAPTNVSTTQALVTLPPIQVALEDPNGNILTGASGNVTLSLGPGAPPNAVLEGTLTQPAVNGVATFNDIKVTIAGPVTLVASCPNFLPATTTLTVTPLNVGFQGRVDEPLFNWPGGSIVSADLNGDGIPDLIVDGYYSSVSGVGVLLGNADGTFRAPVSVRPGVKYPGPMVVADFNHDGVPDVFVASALASNSGSSPGGALLLGNGTGGLVPQPPVLLAGNAGVMSMTVGNFDGSPDIAFITGAPLFSPDTGSSGPFANMAHDLVIEHVSSSGNVRVLLAQPLSNGGPGNFHPSGIAAGDFNGDHALDVAVTGTYVYPSSRGPAVVGVAITVDGHGGTAPFSATPRPHFDELTTGSKAEAFVPTAVTAARGVLEGDTDSLLVGGVVTDRSMYYTRSNSKYFSTYLNAYGPAETQVLIGKTESASTSGPAFTNVLPPLLMSGVPNSMVVADVNHDGKPDLVAHLPAVRGLGVYLGAGGGSFGSEEFSTVGGGQGLPRLHPFLSLGSALVPSTATARPNVGGPSIGELSIFEALDWYIGTGNTATVCLPRTGGFEVATTNSPGDTISIVQGRADGSLVVPNELHDAGVFPNGVAVADINGDKIPDAVWTAYSSGGASKLFVALGSGNGQFHTPESFSVSGLNRTGQVFIGNFAGDPADVAIATGKYSDAPGYSNTAESVVVVPFDGTGAPQLQRVQSTPLGRVSAFASGDVNGDGKLDIAWTNDNGTNLGLNNGDGTFTLNTNVGPRAKAVVIGDVNHDQVPDVVVAYHSLVTVLLGSNSGGNYTFSGSVNTTANTNNVTQLALGDFNGDSIVDVAAVGFNTGGGFHGTTTELLLGNNSASFVPAQSYTFLAGVPTKIVATDINADGVTDLVLLNSKYSGSNDVTVLLGQSNGTALLPPVFPQRLPGVGGFPTGLAVTDINGDGKPDIVTSDAQDGTITLLLHN
jgi:hypothetical protein